MSCTLNFVCLDYTHKILSPLIPQVPSHFPPIYQAFLEDLLCAGKRGESCRYKEGNNACPQGSHSFLFSLGLGLGGAKSAQNNLSCELIKGQ